MSKLVEVSKVDKLEDGTMKEIMADGREILLARVGDSYYAADNRCPHMGGKLSQGTLQGNVVTCPRHGSQFDLTSGEVIRWLKAPGLISSLGKVLKSPKPLTIYSVNVENDRIILKI